MSALLVSFPKITLILLHLWMLGNVGLSLYRQSGTVENTDSEVITSDEKAEIIRLSEAIYRRIPDVSQFKNPQNRIQTEEEKQLIALILVEKDLLKSLSREIHRSRGDWENLLRKIDETYDEISRLMKIVAPELDTAVCEKELTKNLRKCKDYYCVCTWESFSCKLNMWLNDSPDNGPLSFALPH